jgi:hypothetical protein
LWGNCASKIFLRNTHDETNREAAKLWGEVTLGVGGQSHGAGVVPHATASSGDERIPVVQPQDFATLAIPAAAEGIDHCDTIVHLGARGRPLGRAERLRWRVHPILPERERLPAYRPEEEDLFALARRAAER